MTADKIYNFIIGELNIYNNLASSSDPKDKHRAAIIQKALMLLSPMERDILEQYYVNRGKRYSGHRARLQAKYDYSIAQLYRNKYMALYKYCICVLALQLAAERVAQ